MRHSNCPGLRVSIALAALLAGSAVIAQKKASPGHAEVIAALDKKALRRGQKFYIAQCMTCHGIDGTRTSNPSARAFARAPFKNGTDPYSIWKTLTNGLGAEMPPQSGLTAEQRYDVIHFIRERFLKKRNPTQYFEVDDRAADQAETLACEAA
jgi:mono/diheme cytochrome c family protein